MTQSQTEHYMPNLHPRCTHIVCVWNTATGSPYGYALQFASLQAASSVTGFTHGNEVSQIVELADYIREQMHVKYKLRRGLYGAMLLVDKHLPVEAEQLHVYTVVWQLADDEETFCTYVNVPKSVMRDSNALLATCIGVEARAGGDLYDIEMDSIDQVMYHINRAKLYGYTIHCVFDGYQQPVV